MNFVRDEGVVEPDRSCEEEEVNDTTCLVYGRGNKAFLINILPHPVAREIPKGHSILQWLFS